MGRVYDDTRLASVYQPGNDMPQSSLQAWTRLIGSFRPQPNPTVLEVGAGTGMFCTAMARWLPARATVGVDPSVPMLTHARQANAHPGVSYLAGVAEALPLRDRVFDLALLSRVVHHLTDRRACAHELARVLRSGGVAVIRTTFRERLDALVYHYWPRLRDIDLERFPGQDEVIADFTTAGFSVTAITSLAQPVTVSLRDYHARLTTRPQSKLAYLSEAQFRDGLQRLERDAAAEPLSQPTPVSERYDVLALTTI
jgi:ubiquinone/menaquinone biosynthesis C-methylase UbiE